jgi:hypothetical protein
MLDGDFSPTFMAELMLKDARLALDLARAAKVPTPILEETKRTYEEAIAAGWGQGRLLGGHARGREAHRQEGLAQAVTAPAVDYTALVETSACTSRSTPTPHLRRRDGARSSIAAGSSSATRARSRARRLRHAPARRASPSIMARHGRPRSRCCVNPLQRTAARWCARPSAGHADGSPARITAGRTTSTATLLGVPYPGG